MTPIDAAPTVDCWSSMPQEVGRFPDNLPALPIRPHPEHGEVVAIPGLPPGLRACLWSPGLGELRVEQTWPCTPGMTACALIVAPTFVTKEPSRWWAAVAGAPAVPFVLAPRPPVAAPAPCVPPVSDPNAPRTPVDVVGGHIPIWSAEPLVSACPVWSDGRPSRLPVRALIDKKGRLDLGLDGTWRMGEYPLDVGLPDGRIERLRVRLPIPWAWLFFLSGAGLLASTGTAAIIRSAIRDALFARRHARAVARLRTAREDHEPLLARIQALLGFCGQRVRAGWTPRHLIDFDHFEPALREAEQLLDLQARKAALWRASVAMGLPPTAAVRFSAWLRRMDEEILALRLPMDDASLAAPLPAESQARALLDDARLSFTEDVSGNLDGRAEVTPPPFAEDDPAPLPEILTRTVGEEMARLHDISDRTSRSPLALREADIRLDVLRAIQGALTSLDQPEHNLDEPHVRRSLRRYREVDLREAAPTEVHHPMLRALRWTPLNRRHARRLATIHDDPAPADEPDKALYLHVEIPNRWPTFEPTPLALRLFDEHHRWHWLEQTYLWRRLIRVKWMVHGGAVEPGAADPTLVQRDGDLVVWTSTGPRSAAFATRPGPIRVEAVLTIPTPFLDVEVRKCSLEGTAQAEHSDEARHLRTLQWEGARRSALNVVLTVAVVALIAWQAQDGRQGLLPYVWAALLPFGVDLSTGIALGNLGPSASALIQRWVQGR